MGEDFRVSVYLELELCPGLRCLAAWDKTFHAHTDTKISLLKKIIGMRDMPWHVLLKDDRIVDSKFCFKEVHRPKKMKKMCPTVSSADV